MVMADRVHAFHLGRITLVQSGNLGRERTSWDAESNSLELKSISAKWPRCILKVVVRNIKG